jgi:hypothetical protein
MNFESFGNKRETPVNNVEQGILDKLPYFIDEPNAGELIKEIRSKQKMIDDKDSVEFKELELELKNIKFKNLQAETYRDLYDNDLDKEEKDSAVETLRKQHLRKVIFDSELHFARNGEEPHAMNEAGLRLFLAKRELYGNQDYKKEEIEEAVKSWSQTAVEKNWDSYKKIADLDGEYFVKFSKEGYEEKLRSDIEDRKKEGYVFLKDKDNLGKGGFVGVQKQEDGRMDYSQSAKQLN